MSCPKQTTQFSEIPKRHINIKVFANAADKMGAHGRLYWLIKHLDKPGTGRVTVRLKDLTKYFDVTLPTVYRWLKLCKQDGYFYDTIFHGDGTVTVIYRTYKLLLTLLNLEDLGQVVWCDRAQMRNLKPSITIANLQTKQDQSIYEAKQANKSKIGRADMEWRGMSDFDRLILETSGEVRTLWRGPNAIFDRVRKKKKQVLAEQVKAKPKLKDKTTVDNCQPQEPSDQEVNEAKPKKRRRKSILHIGSRFAIVTSSVIPFGASQLGIATDMNRAVATIRRRTQSIERRQMLRVLPISVDEARLLNQSGECDRKILIHDEIPYEVCTNVYNFKGQYETSSSYIYNKRALAYTINNQHITPNIG